MKTQKIILSHKNHRQTKWKTTTFKP